MGSFKLSPNGKSFIPQKVVPWWKQVNEHMGDQFDETFELQIFGWANETKSAERGIKGTTREISDTGRLADSRSLTFQNEGLRGAHEWDAIDPDTGESYAAERFYGGTNSGGGFDPPSNWIQATYMRADVGGIPEPKRT